LSVSKLRLRRVMGILTWLYILLALALALFGFNQFIILALFFRHIKHAPPPPPHFEDKELPTVTVQLPVYNEAWVVERAIDSLAGLDYPSDKLEIQVLDDSDDKTTEIAAKRVKWWQAKGLKITLIHRDGRNGFKAGALAEGLKKASGQFIAIFDADFVPPPDFLRRTIPYFLQNPRLGVIQTRWGHLNREYSPVTRAQALALDGHFLVEQVARQRAGLFMGFNGSAGVWRRRCIEEAGGWQSDTLTEDLDLSYRAQFAGWECLFLPEIVVPAEIPPQLNAFKNQQKRWAKGSIQCLLKLAPAVLRSSRPAFHKFEAILHLSNYLVHPLMLLSLLIVLPLLLQGVKIHFPLTYLTIASFGPPLVYLVAALRGSDKGPREMLFFPLLALMGIGIALNNTVAIAETLLKKGGEFERTPKFRLYRREGDWEGNPYAIREERMALGEILVAFYALAAIVVAWLKGFYWSIPFFLLYVGGFGYVGIGSLWHSLRPVLRERDFRKGRGKSQSPAVKLPYPNPHNTSSLGL
jgi:cellulose synthase/poly-beta-1,6-N-acetylglucosamine synthase-like glycosyltransferase